MFKEEIEHMQKNKFRNGNDVLMPMVTVPQVALKKGIATLSLVPPERFRYIAAAEWNTRLKFQLASTIENLPVLLCFNNTSKQPTAEFWVMYDGFLRDLKR